MKQTDDEIRHDQSTWKKEGYVSKKEQGITCSFTEDKCTRIKDIFS